MDDGNFYNTLGVSPDATADEIKKAYRQRSKETHPDAQGSHDRQLAVNRAYECLKDPVRRANYDATGSDVDIGKAAIAELQSLFDAMLDHALDPDDLVKECHHNVDGRIETHRAAEKELRARLANYLRLGKRMRRKKRRGGGVDIFTCVKEVKIANAKKALRKTELAIMILTQVNKLLDDYEDLERREPEPMPEPGFMSGIFTFVLRPGPGA